MTNIELKDFINQVRDEVLKAYESRSANPVFNLSEVELEVAFTVSATGTGKGKLLVVSLEGEVGIERVHKVTLRLQPIPRAEKVGVSSIVRKFKGIPMGESPSKGLEDLDL